MEVKKIYVETKNFEDLSPGDIFNINNFKDEVFIKLDNRNLYGLNDNPLYKYNAVNIETGQPYIISMNDVCFLADSVEIKIKGTK